MGSLSGDATPPFSIMAFRENESTHKIENKLRLKYTLLYKKSFSEGLYHPGKQRGSFYVRNNKFAWENVNFMWNVHFAIFWPLRSSVALGLKPYMSMQTGIHNWRFTALLKMNKKIKIFTGWINSEIFNMITQTKFKWHYVTFYW